MTLYWWLMAALRHWALRTAGVDLGYFANILWTTLHGNVLAAAISGGSSFGWHFSPSLMLLSIPYAIWQDPLWLTGMQAIFTASGALALALTTRRLGMSRLTSLLVALLWLLSPILRGAMLYDFHEIGMVAGFIAWIVYFAVSGRAVWAILLALLAIGSKEDAPIYIACLGMVLAVSYKKPATGWGIFALAVGCYLLVQYWLWDCIAPHHRDYISVRFPQIYDKENLVGVILGNPLLLFASLWNWDRLWGIVMLLLPVLFLPFRRWGGLGLLPAFWLILSMSVFSPYFFSLHYAAPLLALVIAASIPGLLTSFKHWTAERRLAGCLMLGFTLSLTLAQPPLTVFSQINAAAWRPHPKLALIQQTASATDPRESLTADKFMAPHFTNHMVFKEFPSNLLTVDFYLSNSSMGCPQMPLLIADLGYKQKLDDPICWFLTRKGEIDAKDSFLNRMRWMEAESCDIQSWNLRPDATATQGSAIYLAADEGWGERGVTTPGLLLPPGDYDYTIRYRVDQRPKPHSKIVAGVRFINFAGDDELVTGKIMPTDIGFTDYEYHDARLHFEVKEWGRTYLNINFGLTTSYWLDGIGLEGLPADFAAYYHELFPQPLELSAICIKPELLVPKEDGLTSDALVVDNKQSGQVIARWQMAAGLNGNFTIIGLLESDTDLPPVLSWAVINATWRVEGMEKKQELCKLNLVDQRGWMGVPHLEYSKLDIPPGATLELVVTPDLVGRILLRRLWLTRAPMWNYQ